MQADLQPFLLKSESEEIFMKYLVTGDQAREIDRITVEEDKIPSCVLMERAALCVAQRADEMAGSSGIGNKIKICSVCGTGNNAGDGIAAARILHVRGFDVTVILAGSREKMSGDCAKQLEIASNLSVNIVSYSDMPFNEYGIIIDAVFGTGLGRDVTGTYVRVIERMNEASDMGSRIISVDMPSGINTDSGKVMGTAVRADATVTFGYKKPGHILYPGSEYSGEIFCEEIGFDPEAVIKMNSGMHYVIYDDEDLAKLPKRHPDTNKGSYGRVLVAAGSRNMAGAAVFSAKAAYRTGAGLVYVYTAQSNREIVQSLVPEAVMKSWDDTGPGAYESPLSISDRDELIKALSASSAVVLGPGLGESEAVYSIVRTVIENAYCPLIIDADALNILSKQPEILKECQNTVVITPHMKELSRLTGKNIQYLKENLVQVCVDFKQQYGVICIAKDARTFVFDDSDTVYINTSGNNGMAVGGSGDVLTGVIAGLAAQHMSPEEAARFGVYLHGRAGDLAAESAGRHAMTATDILDAMPELLKYIEDHF